MKNFIPYIALAASAIILTSCGTVSEVVPASDTLSKSYSKVVVKDFVYKGASNEVQGLGSSKIFADYIGNEVSSKATFSSVTRNTKGGADCLIISGDVTRYVAGNAALRALVGFGAGSSYFDADVRFLDGSTGKVIGTMKVDNNSWVLGGGLAAGQSPEAFMRGAAKKVAAESVKFSKNAAP